MTMLPFPGSRGTRRAHPAPARPVSAWALCLAVTGLVGAADAGWRDPALRSTLRNDILEADLQGGRLVRLTDRRTQAVLLDTAAADLPATAPLFGPGPFDLDACAVTQQVAAGSLTCRYEAPDGARWVLHWSIEPRAGDLVLDARAEAAHPVDEMRHVLHGIDLARGRMVMIDNLGGGRAFAGPWQGSFVGDPHRDAVPLIFVHPLVALFEGVRGGLFVEGREAGMGPATLMARGRGERVDVGFTRGFPLGTTSPRMYEIRLRAWQGTWPDAVDPYVEWLERDVGLVPLDRKQPAWVNRIRTQSHVPVGDFEGLEALSRRLDPTKTFLGRRINYRHHAMDVNWPDYAVSDTARRWIRRARELGFRVGVHVNCTAIDRGYADLVDRFRAGLKPVGTDEEGRTRYWGADGLRHLYCSTALKPWRDYLVAQLAAIVDAGVDAIHLDESHTPTGAFVVDGVTAVEGVMLLEREILDAYPHIALETEQFNPMNARRASFALSPHGLGHPLSGYIFHRFIVFLPEGHQYAPRDEHQMDAFTSWGYMLPGAHVGWDESWLQIAAAYQAHDLLPAPRLALGPLQQSAFRGRDGVTAFFEKHAHERGLVVRAADGGRRWAGRRHFGITTWSGPGALSGWPVYDGAALLALDPRKSYAFEAHATLPPDRFHIDRIPADFALHFDDYLDFGPQDAGHDAAPDGSFHHVRMTGHGPIRMHVPTGYRVFLDGRELEIDAAPRSAGATLDAAPDAPSVLWAFRPSDVVLRGRFVDLPWQVPPRQRASHLRRQGDGFLNHVTGRGLILGRFPEADRIRLQGAYGMRPESMMTTGDGVVRLNGREVLRVPAGERPYRARAFDVDISAWAGQHVLLEFTAAGRVRALALADWHEPRIVIEP